MQSKTSLLYQTSSTDALKIVSKRAIPKTAEAVGGNRILLVI